jgi:nitrile hydratase
MDGDSPRQDWSSKPRFAVGDTVLVGDPPTVEHTRLPGYLRNKIGTIETVYEDAYSYLCSTGADGIGSAMPVYCVKFDPQHLWPGNAEPGFIIYADLFDAYVQPVAEKAAA